MSDAHDRAVALVLSVLGGEVINDVNDDIADHLSVVSVRRGKRVRKSSEPLPGQVGLFDD